MVVFKLVVCGVDMSGKVVLDMKAGARTNVSDVWSATATPYLFRQDHAQTMKMCPQHQKILSE
jgi:hypothetical protein